MTNKEIAQRFQSLGQIMELHGENPFKIRSYSNAYISLRKLGTPLSEMSAEEIGGIKGVGKAIAAKIQELLETGEMQTYQKYVDKTPEGIVELLALKGFGPKKIKVVWKELGVESVGELKYACIENRLMTLKGFGAKTQADLIEKINYFQQSQHLHHYAKVAQVSQDLIEAIKALAPNLTIVEVGALGRKAIALDKIEWLIKGEGLANVFQESGLEKIKEENGLIHANHETQIPIEIRTCEAHELGSKRFRFTSSPIFMEAFLAKAEEKNFKEIGTEAAVFAKAKLPFIPAELREDERIFGRMEVLDDLVEMSSIQGIIHSHTTYSDGLHTLEEMAAEAKALGYSYIGITDHSKSAFYANGLKIDRLQEQWKEIDALNARYEDFRILKGIESDILNDGSLDYEEAILKQFDFVIASIHSNLKMDEVKATARLITAIENPYTFILGHPTGRLLLSRKGYPIDHRKVIDACAANGVAIELNAHPYRLDLDWTWIPYAMEKGVKISINPDAHSKEGIQDIKYGVLAARKGGLTNALCLNARPVKAFLKG